MATRVTFVARVMSTIPKGVRTSRLIITGDKNRAPKHYGVALQGSRVEFDRSKK
jgi:hypothetical protein